MKFSEIYENILTMLYIIILVVTTIIIILYSKNIYEKIEIGSASDNELYIVMSYVNVKVRQNDVKDAIYIGVLEETGENALLIRKKDSDTWLYDLNGAFLESTVLKDEQPNNANAIKIASVIDFDIDKVGNLLNYSVAVSDELKAESSIYLRSVN